MWCPECNKDFDNISICPECGAELKERPRLSWGRSAKIGEIVDRWPKKDNGEPEDPVLLMHCTSLDLGDEITINMLEAYGIPCLRHYPQDGGFGKVMMGMSGTGVDIFVPESMYEDADELLKGEPEDGLQE